MYLEKYQSLINVFLMTFVSALLGLLGGLLISIIIVAVHNIFAVIINGRLYNYLQNDETGMFLGALVGAILGIVFSIKKAS